ncbi:MAG: hypothetical protein QOF33_1458 [Thermomicrobiales bacterium]|jgi:hypothetical protein|nr:hypothetical protein [Thermomicrobiales bacterium]MEA2523878.1 hypothetical protein [Thermomicrobiales bacterium]MEA2583373.1 hypothetical protein [Thermomicrobiales bacterium]MEA2597115.1 hypothetical protein [Thermomicrobiales bacterium]
MIKLARADPELAVNGLRRGGRLARESRTVPVAVTERALRALVALRTAEHAMPGQALGLVVGPAGSVSLVLDLPGARDRVFSRDDTPILFIDVELGSRLAGRVLDHDGAPGQERFTLEPVPQDESPPDRGSRPS